MEKLTIPLCSSVPGTARELTVWRFGQAGARPRVYLQAGLHADEIPGMLTLTVLRERLTALDEAGLIAGEILLAPVANPIGLAQQHLWLNQGRFEAGSGQNFNRRFPNLAPGLLQRLAGVLPGDATAKVARVRAELGALLAEQAEVTELDSLRLALFRMAVQSDVVLDLHCDSEAELHLYAHSAQLDEAQVLAGFLKAQALLHATEMGGQSFDDSCTKPWWQLQQICPELPLACFAVTVELRGQCDVSRELAMQDAEGLLNYLKWRGAVAGEAAILLILTEPTPLAGTAIVTAPHGGVVVYSRPIGGQVKAGELLGELVDPLDGRVSPLRAPVSGVYYARSQQRFVVAGAELSFIAGREALRQGDLLSA